jgi:hypothetical protein
MTPCFSLPTLEGNAVNNFSHDVIKPWSACVKRAFVLICMLVAMLVQPLADTCQADAFDDCMDARSQTCSGNAVQASYYVNEARNLALAWNDQFRASAIAACNGNQVCIDAENLHYDTNAGLITSAANAALTAIYVQFLACITEAYAICYVITG